MWYKLLQWRERRLPQACLSLRVLGKDWTPGSGSTLEEQRAVAALDYWCWWTEHQHFATILASGLCVPRGCDGSLSSVCQGYPTSSWFHPGPERKLSATSWRMEAYHLSWRNGRSYSPIVRTWWGTCHRFSLALCEVEPPMLWRGAWVHPGASPVGSKSARVSRTEDSILNWTCDTKLNLREYENFLLECVMEWRMRGLYIASQWRLWWLEWSEMPSNHHWGVIQAIQKKPRIQRRPGGFGPTHGSAEPWAGPS